MFRTKTNPFKRSCQGLLLVGYFKPVSLDLGLDWIRKHVIDQIYRPGHIQSTYNAEQDVKP